MQRSNVPQSNVQRTNVTGCNRHAVLQPGMVVRLGILVGLPLAAILACSAGTSLGSTL